MIPYILMAVLFLVLAILAALESSFASLGVLPWFSGMVWLRVHLITLGALTQIIFGMLPILTAIRQQQARPKIRWDIWLTLNAGILSLLVGIPLVSRVPIIVGGTLVFIATTLLMFQLAAMRSSAPTKKSDQLLSGIGRKFYLAGLFYFLLGILIGTGLWNGWMTPLGVIGNGKEVHIHANSWGMMSLVFTGLLVDLYPVWTGRALAYPKSVAAIFWMMFFGAFGLIFGPWLANTYLLVPGLVLHLAATIGLLVNVIRPIWGDKPAWTAGVYHLILSYFWILAPIAMAPFVLFNVPGLPGPAIEASAPQALIYGWVLQFGFAIIPYFVARTLMPNQPAKLGGTWLSLLFVNLGGIFLWASIFVSSAQATLHGIAYLLWVIAMLPVGLQLWRMVHDGVASIEENAALIGRV